MSETCKGSTWQGRIGLMPCRSKAKRDGYCGVHHPDAVKLRKERVYAKWRAMDEQHSKRASDATYALKLAAYRAGVEAAVRELDRYSWPGLPSAREIIRALPDPTPEELEKIK